MKHLIYCAHALMPTCRACFSLHPLFSAYPLLGTYLLVIATSNYLLQVYKYERTFRYVTGHFLVDMLPGTHTTGHFYIDNCMNGNFSL